MVGEGKVKKKKNRGGSETVGKKACERESGGAEQVVCVCVIMTVTSVSAGWCVVGECVCVILVCGEDG